MFSLLAALARPSLGKYLYGIQRNLGAVLLEQMVFPHWEYMVYPHPEYRGTSVQVGRRQYKTENLCALFEKIGIRQ